MSTSDELDRIEAALATGRYADARRGLDGLPEVAHGDDRVRCELAWLTLLARTGGSDPERAERLLDDVRGMAREAQAEYVLGMSLFGTHRLEAAERHLTEAVGRARRQGDERLAWRAVAYLGLSRARRQDLQGGERMLREAATGLAALGDDREAAARWVALTTLLTLQGRRDEAREALARAEQCAREVPDVLADVLRSQASLARQDGDLDGALALLHRARRLLEGAPSIGLARVLNDLGDAARSQGHFDEARAHFEASIRVRQGRDDAITRLNLALLEHDRGAREAAREALRPILDARVPTWPQVLAHGLSVALADDGPALDRHLDALDAMLARRTSPDRDLLRLFRDSTGAWSDRDPARAARIAALWHGQARAHRSDLSEVEGTLVVLRRAGAPVPLGPLDVREEVAGGGMGQVWRGEVRGTALSVAVKVLPQGRAHEASVRLALHRELRAVARLDHPHIVPLVDHGEIGPAAAAMTGGHLHSGAPWLAMRWAGAGTLAQWCGQRPWTQVRQALLQLLDALAAAHADGLLHLDVKPANVLVAQEAPLVTWLADFGVARALGADADQRVAGTPAYMAPEQCRGLVRQYGPWTDLYAVGGTAAALVQGRAVFEGDHQALMQQQVGRAAPPLQPRIPVPGGFEGWCRRLLAKDPEHRYRCAADAAAALRALGSAPDGPLRPGAPPAASCSSSSTFLLDAIPFEVARGAQDLPAVVRAEVPQQPPPTSTRPTPLELASAASRLLPLRRVPLVGRDLERDALWSALLRARSGVEVVRLEAARGGRTQLLRWLAELVTRTGAARAVWVGSTGGDPWRNALRELLLVRDPSLDALEQTLARQLDIHVGPGSFGETERGLLAQVLADHGDAHRGTLDPVPMFLRVVEAMSEERPVVVCLATADSGCHAFVERLLAAMRDLPVLVVAAREVALPEDERVRTVRLGPLDDRRIAELLDALVPLEPTLRDRVVRAAAGEPATAVWTVRNWLADRALLASPDGLQLTRDQELPGSPDDAIRQALAPVLQSGRAFRARLELAAVLGDHVPRDAWRRACEAAGLAPQPALVDALVSRGLLREDAAGYWFGDSRVRGVVLDGVEPRQLQQWHLAAASALDDPGRQGLHLLQAGAAADALPLLAQAVDGCSRRAPRIAAALLERWREARSRSGLPDDAPEVVRGEVVGWRVRLPAPEERGRVEARLEAARRLEDRDTEVQALLVWSVLRGRDGDLEACVRGTDEALVRCDSDRLRASALRAAGRARLAIGDDDGAIRLLREAANVGDGTARIWLVATLQNHGRHAEAVQWAEVAQVAREVCSYQEAVQRLCQLSVLLANQGHAALAAKRHREAVALGRACSPRSESIALTTQISVALRLGDGGAVRRIVARLAQLPQIKRVRAIRALLEEGEIERDVRLSRAREALRGGPNLDRAEIAGLIELAVAMPWWLGHEAALRDLADEVRAGAEGT